jgi:hypothetical protein
VVAAPPPLQCHTDSRTDRCPVEPERVESPLGRGADRRECLPQLTRVPGRLGPGGQTVTLDGLWVAQRHLQVLVGGVTGAPALGLGVERPLDTVVQPREQVVVELSGLRERRQRDVVLRQFGTHRPLGGIGLAGPGQHRPAVVAGTPQRLYTDTVREEFTDPLLQAVGLVDN